MTRRLEEERRRDILEWLQAPSIDQQYDTHVNARLEGTCDWIFEQEAYKSWVSADTAKGPTKLLWIHGPAGSGKTVLSASIIQQRTQFLDEGHSLLYCFCSPYAQAGSKFEDIVRTWIWQLIRRTPSVVGSIWEYMNSPDIDKGTVASQTHVWKVWTDLLSKSPGCVVVIDGFDEFNEPYRRQSKFIQRLKAIAAKTNTGIMVTSRNEGDIRDDILSTLEGPSDIMTLECPVSKELVRADLDRLASSEISSRLGGKSDEIKKELSSRLAEKSDGMFLWIKQQNLDQLQPTKNSTQLRQIVEKMPKTLVETYMRTWRDIESRPDDDRERTMAILRLVAFSLHPLTVVEIIEALLVTPNTTNLNIDDWPDEINEDYIRNEIKGLCGSLIDVRTSGDNDCPGSRTLQLAHASVKEFLLHKLCTSVEESSSEASKLAEHHLALAKVCLQYISYPEVWQPILLPEDRQIPYAFLDYASESWHEHIIQAQQENEEMYDLEKAFLDPDNSSFQSWRARMIDQDPVIPQSEKENAKKLHGNPLISAVKLNLTRIAEYLLVAKPDLMSRKEESGFTAMNLACANGLLTIVNLLLRNGAKVDEEIAPKRTSLNFATIYRHKDVVACLLDHGADINLTDLNGCTPLRHACSQQHLEIAIFLLDKGADPTIADNETSTRLYWACQTGSLALISLLVEKGAKKTINTARNDGATPLYVCSECSQPKIATYLLENGARDSVNVKYKGNTSLHVAAAKGNIEVLQLLLDHGADLGATRTDGRTAFHDAATWGNVEAVKLMLKNGAEINAVDNERFTPLLLSTFYSRHEVSQLLLEMGADWKKPNDGGWTVLHFAAGAGFVDIVKRLIDSGADKNGTDDTGMTPMAIAASTGQQDVIDYLIRLGANDESGFPAYQAASSGQLDVVKFFLEYNPSILNTASKTGETLLQIAVKKNHPAVLRCLLDRGADVDIVENGGWTPLHGAAEWNYPDMVRALVDHGADIHAKSESGSTPLRCAVDCGNLEIADYLLECGADSSEFLGGVGLLHAAAQNGHREIVELLLKHGLDLEIKSENEWTPLACAAREGKHDVASLLLEHGANISAQDSDGWTPLMRGALGGHLRLAEMLLKHGADISNQDFDGLNALMAAASQGHTELVEYLLKQGAELDHRDKDGVTAVLEATQSGRTDTVAVLLNHGADVTTPCCDGYITLHASVSHVPIMQRLLDHGVDIETKDVNGWTVLREAVFMGVYDSVAFLLSRGANASTTGFSGYTPLHSAAALNKVRIIQALLDHGVDIEEKGPRGLTALRNAAMEGRYEATTYLLSRGANASATCNSGYTPLHSAAYYKKPQIIQALLDHGVDIVEKDSNGWTALHFATVRSSYECVVYLLSRGAEASARTSDGWTPLHAAVEQSLEVTEVLVESGADIETKGGPESKTALRLAVEMNKSDIVEHLLRSGADPASKCNGGYSNLHKAALKGYLDIAKHLVNHGADMGIDNNPEEMSALYLASYKGHIDLAEFFMQRGASLSTELEDGYTPLHGAAMGGQTEMCEFLLKHGAKIRSEGKVTPLHAAAASGNLAVAEYILEIGVNVQVEYHQGFTPLHAAIGEKQTEMVEFLLKHGADPNSTHSAGKSPLYEETPLFGCVLGGHCNVTEYLIDQGADLQIQNKDEWRPLHVATYNNEEDLARLLVDRAASLEVRDNRGMAPLHLAAEEGNAEVLGCLLELGADITSKDDEGETPLHIAANQKQAGIVDILLGHDADVSARCYYSRTPLDVAVIENREDAVRTLLKHGADPTALNYEGRNAIHFAAFNGSTESCKLLLNCVSNFDALIDSSPWNPFNDAATAGAIGILEAFLDQRPASYFKQDFEDRTAFHMAAGGGDIPTFEFLMMARLDPTARDSRGRTILHYAAASSSLELVERILKLPCSKDLIQSHSGFTPLHWAARAGDPQLITTLISAGIRETIVRTNFPKRATYWTPWALAKFFQNEKLLSEPDSPLKLRQTPPGVSPGKQDCSFYCSSCGFVRQLFLTMVRNAHG